MNTGSLAEKLLHTACLRLQNIVTSASLLGAADLERLPVATYWQRRGWDEAKCCGHFVLEFDYLLLKGFSAKES